MPISGQKQKSGNMRPSELCSIFDWRLFAKFRSCFDCVEYACVMVFACDRLPKVDCTVLLSGPDNALRQCYSMLQCEYAACQDTVLLL